MLNMTKHLHILFALSLCVLSYEGHSAVYVNRLQATKKTNEPPVDLHIRHKVVKSKQGAEVGYSEQLNDTVQLGGEMDVDDFSKMDFDNLLNFKQLGVDLLATATLSVSNEMDVFAKAGMTNVENGPPNTDVTSNKMVKSTPKVVLGTDYNVNDHFSITGKVSHIFDNNQENQNPLLDTKGNDSSGGSIGFKLKW